MKSLNLPNIPSSLTVSKASIPITSSSFPVMPPPISKPSLTVPKSIPNVPISSVPKPIPNLPKPVPNIHKSVPGLPKPVLNMPKPVPNVPKSVSNLPKSIPSTIPNFPMDMGRPATITTKPLPPQPNFTMEPSIPPTLTVSKTAVPLPTVPKFSPESGISVSQVSVSQSTKTKEKSTTSSKKKNSPSSLIKPFSTGMSVDISLVKTNPSEKKGTSNTTPKLVSSNKLKERSKKILDFGQKQSCFPKKPVDINPNKALPGATLSKVPIPVTYSNLGTGMPPGHEVTKVFGDPKESNQEQVSIIRKDNQISKSASSRNMPPPRKESSDDDVICLD
ncbi:hypothetical protein NQ317_010313 [Molorchus minor]|uniref:Uncharacterized protein n=1 Tax=Molorchus minor TaxID=1323400 RepID=A0ABQ9J0D7_9CUCU|nr:hypothetical protein NQ317_010313 [Molorchus minor]